MEIEKEKVVKENSVFGVGTILSRMLCTTTDPERLASTRKLVSDYTTENLGEIINALAYKDAFAVALEFLEDIKTKIGRE